MSGEFRHVPVMLEECMQALNLGNGKIYVDCTLGGGGHSQEILRRTDGSLIAVDKDEDAIRAASQRLAEFGKRVTYVKSDYCDVPYILEQAGVEKVDGVLMDLGVSSYQLDHMERGFSYRGEDAPLDMRMDRSQELTAAEVVNTYDERKLTEILREYGEEKFARNIAGNIVQARAAKRLETCGELVEIVYRSIPAAARRTGGHPAKRTFQAIRIEVNGELEHLKQAVVDWSRALKPDGRIAVITFHSLEDRIVKHAFRDLEIDCVCDKRLPVCVCGKVQELEVLTKKPIEASAEELERNSRSQSAKLRVAKRVEGTAKKGKQE